MFAATKAQEVFQKMPHPVKIQKSKGGAKEISTEQKGETEREQGEKGAEKKGEQRSQEREQPGSLRGELQWHGRETEKDRRIPRRRTGAKVWCAKQSKTVKVTINTQ